ncbi:hypothetical protein EJ08DRAFT_664108 [Tothia fuscella]|uniref:Uncharacterized protein n=1 Tax=Tothia fuscella TaxID=1048955 RepID=A0A9P4TVD3_9PEZI|nr:hypothetical protein EJ08DRAFT_664108 [Tothia fuscella]
MDPPPFKFAASPSTPLFPLSPERVNSKYNGTLQQSPSHPEFGKTSMGIDPFLFNGGSPTSHRHSRNNSASDAAVGSMVARFESLSVRDHKAASELAVKRADMAREMAELERDKLKRELAGRDEEYRKLKEEGRRMRKELEETRERERLGMKRLDVAAEEIHRAKETHTHAINVYEKEVRKIRKEAFKSGSALVKLQEELKGTRNSLRITQSGLDSEKMKCSKREQEAFTAQYQLVGLQEELQKAQEEMKVILEERDTLKTNLKEEEVARIAAEGMIALPAIEDDEDLLNSPRKSPRKVTREDSEDKENVVPKRVLELKSLQEELSLERRLRARAQDQVDFMKMECQFKMCSCRIAEKNGHSYIHDNNYADEMERIKQCVPISIASEENEDEQMEDIKSPQKSDEQVAEPAIRFSPSTGTFAAVASPSKMRIVDPPESMTEDETELVLDFDERDTRSSTLQHEPARSSPFHHGDLDSEMASPEKPRSVMMDPQTPHREIRTVTTTTTIPITFSPFPARPSEEYQPLTPMTVGHPPFAHPPGSPFPSKAFNEDGTLDREAALRQIRERRGRARSVQMGHATPRKQMMEGTNGRRDISAPSFARSWSKT